MPYARYVTGRFTGTTDEVRRPFHCTEPVCEQFRGDAALNADYYGGILRSYYDGKQRWPEHRGGRRAKR